MNGYHTDSEGYVIPRYVSHDDGLYAILVTDDAPYHEGVEFWCRSSLEKLLYILSAEWSWMREKSDVSIVRAVFGSKCTDLELIYLSSSGKFKYSGNVDTSLYPDYPPLPKDIHFCKYCTIFYKEEGACKECANILESIND